MRSTAIRCWHCAVRSITAHFIRYLHGINTRNQRRKNCLKLPIKSAFFTPSLLSFLFCCIAQQLYHKASPYYRNKKQRSQSAGTICVFPLTSQNGRYTAYYCVLPIGIPAHVSSLCFE